MAKSSSSSSSSPSQSPAACPFSAPMNIRLSFAKMVWKTDECVVTSLQSSDSDVLEIKDLDGNAASTGDLIIYPKFDFTAGTTKQNGYTVFKGLTGTQFLVGDVTEGLKAGSDFVQLSGSQTRVDSGDGATIYQGIVTVDIQDTSIARDGPAQLVDLGGAREESSNGIMYLSLPPARDSELVFQVALPVLGMPSSPKLRLELWILAPSAGNLPTLGLEYLRVARPTAACTSVKKALPTAAASWTSLTDLSFASCGAMLANQYIRVLGDEITTNVAAGDVFLFRLSRDGDGGDGYAGGVGILQHRWRISAS